MLKSFDDAGRTRWATKVKQLFLNMVKVWFGYYTMIVIVIRLSRRLGWDSLNITLNDGKDMFSTPVDVIITNTLKVC